MKIGHISDIHWLDTTGARMRDFLNKRLTGGINLLAGRAKTHSKEAVQNALQTLKSQNIDQLIVTGDLTNLALPGEFHAVKSVLNEFFDDDHLSIVPGNHDFYTRESARLHRFFSMIYGDALPGDEPDGDPCEWPFVQLRGEAAIIGLNSCQPRPWFVAAGRLGARQLQKLALCLKDPEVQSRYIIVALHHHLFQVVTTPGEALRHLDDRREFLDICLKGHVNLILHGHNHDFTQMRVDNTFICEPGSCSVARFKRDNRAGKFNIYNIEDRRLKSIETWRYDDNIYKLWHTSGLDDFKIVDSKDL